MFVSAAIPRATNEMVVEILSEDEPTRSFGGVIIRDAFDKAHFSSSRLKFERFFSLTIGCFLFTVQNRTVLVLESNFFYKKTFGS